LDYSEEYFLLAAQMFEQAAELDPAFMEAWTQLTWVHSMLFFNTDPSESRGEMATAAFDRARGLAPQSPLVREAAGFYHYRVRRDFDRALQEFSLALQDRPGNVEVMAGISFVRRRKGQWQQAVEMLKKAFVLDPRDARLAYTIGETHYALRQYGLAVPYLDRAAALAPDQDESWGARTLSELELTGSVEAARRVLDRAPGPGSLGLLYYWAALDLFERDFEGVLDRLTPAATEEVDEFHRTRLYFMAALAQDRLGQTDRAKETLETCRGHLELAMVKWPANSHLISGLAQVNALIGRRVEALQGIGMAHERYRGDAFSGPLFLEAKARILTALGDHQAAIGILEGLLVTPYQNGIGPVQLQLDPVWDPLREYDGFQHLLRRATSEPTELAGFVPMIETRPSIETRAVVMSRWTAPS
jgi:tetratricopeptide (TPR) repeat protein